VPVRMVTDVDLQKSRQGRCQVSPLLRRVRRPSTEKWTTQEQHGFTYDDGIAVVGCTLLDAGLSMFILTLEGFSGKLLSFLFTPTGFVLVGQ